MASFYRFQLIAFLVLSITTSSLAQILSDAERFDPANLPIFESRVFRVPDATQQRALSFLADNEFARANPKIVKELFGERAFDTKEMLAAQAAAANKYADKRAKEAEEPFFGTSRVWMAAHAKAHRELAAYTNSLSLKLCPYLVKGQVYFESTGGFTIVLTDRTLGVHHLCLGRSTPPKKSVAILVFLERDIEAVRVSASIAE